MAVLSKAPATADAMRNAVSKKKSAGKYLTKIPAGETTIRFLDEPGPGWRDYQEFFDPDLGHSVIVTDSTIIPAGQYASKRYLTNVVVVDDNRVEPMVFPLLLTRKIMKLWERNEETITDRDFIVSKEGSGKETEYDIWPEAPLQRDTTRFEDAKFDLEALLEEQIEMQAQESAPARESTSSTSKPKTLSKKLPVD